MHGHERTTKSSFAPSSLRSRVVFPRARLCFAAADTSIRASPRASNRRRFARTLRAISPRDSSPDDRMIRCVFPQRTTHTVEEVFCYITFLASFDDASFDASPRDSFIRLDPRLPPPSHARSNASPARRARASPSRISSTVASLLAHPSPRLGLGHVNIGPRNTSRTTASTSTSRAPTRSSAPSILARHPSRAARTTAVTTARMRLRVVARAALSGRPAIDPIAAPSDEKLTTPGDGRW